MLVPEQNSKIWAGQGGARNKTKLSENVHSLVIPIQSKGETELCDLQTTGKPLAVKGLLPFGCLRESQGIKCHDQAQV